MAQSQSQLAARLAAEFGLPAIRFVDADGLVFQQGDVVKIFMPHSKRILGCGAQDRRVHGYLVCLFAEDIKVPTGRSKKFDYVRHICSVHDANFPGLIPHSLLSDDPMDELFQLGLRKLFAALPNDRAGWLDIFGADFLSSKGWERTSAVIQYLDGKLEELGEPFEDRPLPDGMTIEIRAG